MEELAYRCRLNASDASGETEHEVVHTYNNVAIAQEHIISIRSW